MCFRTTPTLRAYVETYDSLLAPLEKRPPLVVAYGMGVDSTAMLVEMARLGIRPDLILFADTGDENPETYNYLSVINAFLRANGFPAVIVVRRLPTRSRKSGMVYRTLGENCVANETLPSLAFGRKGCSQKWKREPQDKYVNGWEPARAAWVRGHKVVKLIGYDAGPKDARRSKIADDAKYTYLYPLREWGWDRERCVAEIKRTGLPVPPKSACVFCPATNPEELEALIRRDVQVAYKIIGMEAVAAPNLKKIDGLWRKATKKRPGAMTPFVRKVLRRIADEEVRGVVRSPALRVLREDAVPTCSSLCG